jgi:hypothetical protein
MVAAVARETCKFASLDAKAASAVQTVIGATS